MGLNHYLVVSNGLQPTITLTNEWFSSDIVGFDEDLMGCNFEITNQLDMIFGLGVSWIGKRVLCVHYFQTNPIAITKEE